MEHSLYELLLFLSIGHTVFFLCISHNILLKMDIKDGYIVAILDCDIFPLKVCFCFCLFLELFSNLPGLTL